MMKCILIVISLIELGFGQYNAHAEFPEIGKACPNFIIRNIEYYSKKQVTLEDFKGKWFILDFWGKYCSGCIKAFPEINRIEQQFKKDVQLISICYVWRDGGEQTMFKKYKESEHLEFPVAFDSLVCQRFNISGTPHCIVVDDKGVVRAITSYIESAEVAAFLKGDDPRLDETYSGDEKRDSVRKANGTLYNRKLAFWLEGSDKDTSIVYRSVLARYDKNAGFTDKNFSDYKESGKFSQIAFTNLPLSILYFCAFTGHTFQIGLKDNDYSKIYPVPILETKDSAMFSFETGYGNRSNMYSFSLSMQPKSDLDENLNQFKLAMQRELRNYFGYNARVEKRMMPYLRLVVTSKEAKAKLHSKGGISYTNNSFASKVYINTPLDNLLYYFTYGHVRGPVILNETGISFPVDMSLNVSFDAPIGVWKAELNKCGLDLLWGEKEMQVLVIGDPI